MARARDLWAVVSDESTHGLWLEEVPAQEMLKRCGADMRNARVVHYVPLEEGTTVRIYDIEKAIDHALTLKEPLLAQLRRKVEKQGHIIGGLRRAVVVLAAEEYFVPRKAYRQLESRAHAIRESALRGEYRRGTG